MLEELLIFTRGGLILWSSCRALGVAALKGSPIDALIRSCLLEDRAADATFSQDGHALKWTFNNDLGLVFVAVYQRVLHLLYVDDLLAAVRKEFSQIYHPRRSTYHDFDDVFRQLHLEAEARAEGMRKTKHSVPSRNKTPAAAPKPRGAGSRPTQDAKDSDGDSAKDQPAATVPALLLTNNRGKENGGPNDNNNNNNNNNNGAFDVNKLHSLVNSKKKKKKNVPAPSNTTTKPDITNPKKKVNRVWDDKPTDNKKLDFTDPADERGDELTMLNQGDSMMDKDDNVSSDADEDDEVQDGPKKKGWLSSMFHRHKHRLLDYSAFLFSPIFSMLIMKHFVLCWYSVSQVTMCWTSPICSLRSKLLRTGS
jgi:signal recognition particle receptor subunit alpha